MTIALNLLVSVVAVSAFVATCLLGYHVGRRVEPELRAELAEAQELERAA